jgi:Uncharacterised nucleotidyltransferase
MIGAGFTPEERLILGCLRRDAAMPANRLGLNDTRPHGLADECGVAFDRIDWRRVTFAAGSHGVLPLVYRQLKSADGVAPDALAPMRSEFYGNALNNLHLARELARLASLFGRQSIEVIAFKGPVLALQAWEDVALRQFNDLDLLVHPADAARAVEVLIADGYAALTFDRQHPELSIARRCEDEFMRPGSAAMTDLHWELNPSYFAYGPLGAEVWNRSESIRVEGGDVMTLGPADLVLFLAVHATKHGWINLGWICDFNAALHTLPDSELHTIVEAARRSGCLRMLLLAIALAAGVLDAPLPPGFGELIRRDSAVAAMTAGIERRLFASVGMRARLYSEWAVPIRAITSVGGRVHYLASRALTPNIDDFKFIALPPPLHRLYYATRPLRLAWQQSRRLFVDVPHPLKRLPGAPR